MAQSADGRYAPDAAITDLGTAGTSTTAQLEVRINLLTKALRDAGIVAV